MRGSRYRDDQFRLVQTYPTLLILASNTMWGFQEFRSILRAEPAGNADDSDRYEPDRDGQTRKTEPIPEAGVRATPVVERDRHRQDAVGFLGQGGPDLAIAVDEGG